MLQEKCRSDNLGDIWVKSKLYFSIDVNYTTLCCAKSMGVIIWVTAATPIHAAPSSRPGSTKLLKAKRGKSPTSPNSPRSSSSILAGQHPPLQSDKRPQTWTDYSGFWLLNPQKETRGLRSCSRTCFELNVTTFAKRPMLPACSPQCLTNQCFQYMLPACSPLCKYKYK